MNLPRNQTTLRPSDSPPEENFKNKRPRLKVVKVKSAEDIIPREVVEFIQGFLKQYNLCPLVNVLINGRSFPYFFEEQKIVLDYLREETPDELERLAINRDLCKKLGLQRISISQWSYKNQLTKILEV